MKNAWFILLFELVLLGACAIGAPALDHPVTSQTPSAPVVSDTLPRPGDDTLTRGPVFIDSSELLSMESYPLQFSLSIKGSLPTPCHSLRVQVQPPDTTGALVVDAYSVSDPARGCAEVLQPFEANIPLGSFPPGHYRLFLNGQQVAEFIA